MPDQLALETVLRSIGPTAVAVSGGVDSMTLAHVAHLALGDQAEMFHAISPAVPAEATERVTDHAQAAGWRLRLIDAGETTDERYLANPVDRCYFCKTNLYGFISDRTERTVVSGTNTDDLGDYRPGLVAAEEHGVRHPYVEAGLDKNRVRALAARLGLHDLAELPAAPCLSSRIETGLRVTPRRLSTVETIERTLRERLPAENLRCRIRATGVVIELDASLVTDARRDLTLEVAGLLRDLGAPENVTFEEYRRGSSFLRETST